MACGRNSVAERSSRTGRWIGRWAVTRGQNTINWTYRDSLNVIDRVILYLTVLSYPRLSVRDRVLRILHSAHQGVSSMESRARSIVFWLGMTNDIRAVREHCSACNRSAPSQPATPAIPSPVPSTPVDSIVADFFDFGGCHYILWLETDYRDESRYSKLLMGQHKPVFRA